MKSKRSRLTLVGTLVVALGLLAGAGGAQAAKVTKNAAGGPLAGAPGGVTPPFIAGAPLTQTFKLKGKKVKRKQILDVNITVNSTGSVGGANFGLHFELIAPNGANTYLSGAGGLPGQNLANLKFDDQSNLDACDPLFFQASDCNYLLGSTPEGAGTMTGTVSGFLNPVFRGGNPKGFWRLVWWDTGFGGIALSRSAAAASTHTIGRATLRVKTGKRFAKQGT